MTRKNLPTGRMVTVSGPAGVLVFLLVIALFVAVIVGFIALFPFLLMLVWNAVVPAIFPQAPLLNFWQALGLWWLFQLLGAAFRGLIK